MIRKAHKTFVGDSMVEGKPSTGFRLVFTLPLQQGEYDTSELASQHHQGLSGAETPISLFLVKPFPGFGSTRRHSRIVQKAGFWIASLGQTPATIFLP